MKLSYCLVRQAESLACREHADQVEEQHPRCRRTVHLPSCFKVSLSCAGNGNLAIIPNSSSEIDLLEQGHLSNKRSRLFVG